MNKPTVSIIIPAFNNGPYLAEALDSVFRQCSGCCEVIIVDDGSTDDTEKQIYPYLDRVLFLREENKGVAAARNWGMSRARGDFIAFLDGDDVWLNDNLKIKLDYLAGNPDVCAVFSNFRIIDSLGVLYEDGMRYFYPIFHKRGRRLEQMFSEKTLVSFGGRSCFVHKGNIFESLLFGNFIATCSALIRKECADAVGLFREDLKTQEDYHYWLRLSRLGKIACIDLPLVGYRRHSSQLTRSSNMQMIMQDVARVLELRGDDARMLAPDLEWQFRNRRAEVMNYLAVACLRNGNRKCAAAAVGKGLILRLQSLFLRLSSPLRGESLHTPAPKPDADESNESQAVEPELTVDNKR